MLHYQARKFTETWHNAPYSAIDFTLEGLSVTGDHVVRTGAGTGIERQIVWAFAEAGAACLSLLGRCEGLLYEAASMIKDSTRLSLKVVC